MQVTVDPAAARNIAHYTHIGARTRRGVPVIEHVERVAAATCSDARALAFLHEVLESSTIEVRELTAQGLTQVELAALRLLTRDPAESYELYLLRIVHAEGAAGRLARTVKLADLEDHLREPAEPGAPPYGWARRHIAVARERIDDEPFRPLRAAQRGATPLALGQ